MQSSCISALAHLDAAPTTISSVQRPSVTDYLPPTMPLWVVKSWLFISSHTTPRSYIILPYKYVLFVQYNVTFWGQTTASCSFWFLSLIVAWSHWSRGRSTLTPHLPSLLLSLQSQLACHHQKSAFIRIFVSLYISSPWIYFFFYGDLKMLGYCRHTVA